MADKHEKKVKELNELYAQWKGSPSGDLLLRIRDILTYLGKDQLQGKQYRDGYGVMQDTVTDLITEMLAGTLPYDENHEKKASFATYCWKMISYALKENRRSDDTNAEYLDALMNPKTERDSDGWRIDNEWTPEASVHNVDAAGSEEYLPEDLTDQERLYVKLAVAEGEPDEKYETRRAPTKANANGCYKIPDKKIAAQMGVSTKKLYRIRESIKENIENMELTTVPTKRPAFTLGKGCPTRVCKTWEEWNELISNTFLGVAYPSQTSSPSKTRYSFLVEGGPEARLTASFDYMEKAGAL